MTMFVCGALRQRRRKLFVRFLTLLIYSAVAVAITASVTAASALAEQTTTAKDLVESYSKAEGSECNFARGQPDNEELARCLAELRRLLREDRTPAERALLLHVAAQLEVERGNFRQAIEDIEASFETGALTAIEKAENYFFLGRLYLGVEPPDYDKAIENLRKYIQATDNPDPNAYFYLGQVQALEGECEKAIPNARKAIEIAEKLNENHHRLLLFCYSELEDYKRLVALIERILTMFPIKDEYLSQLATGYRELGREKDAFHVQAFRYALGTLDSEEELLELVRLYWNHGGRHTALGILEDEMQKGRIKRSRKALAMRDSMLRALAKEPDKRRPENCPFDTCEPPLFPARAEWAEPGLRKALNEGTLKEPCRARLLLGRMLHERGDRAGAITQLESAAKSEVCAEAARRWLENLKEPDREDGAPGLPGK